MLTGKKDTQKKRGRRTKKDQASTRGVRTSERKEEKKKGACHRSPGGQGLVWALAEIKKTQGGTEVMLDGTAEVLGKNQTRGRKEVSQGSGIQGCVRESRGPQAPKGKFET